MFLGIGERSAEVVTHLHETELKTGSGFFFFFLPNDTKPKPENVIRVQIEDIINHKKLFLSCET